MKTPCPLCDNADYYENSLEVHLYIHPHYVFSTRLGGDQFCNCCDQKVGHDCCEEHLRACEPFWDMVALYKVSGGAVWPLQKETVTR